MASLSKEHFDFVILGGCPTGVLTAYLLAKAGKKVALVEEQNIGIETTGCYYAAVHTVYPDLSIHHFEDQEVLSGTDLQEPLHHAFRLISDLAKKFPGGCNFRKIHSEDFKPDGEKTRATASYIINAFKYISSLARLCAQEGAMVLENRRVLKMETRDGKNIIYTSRGKFFAGEIIYTPRSSRVLTIDAKKFAPYKSYSLFAKLNKADYSQELAGRIDDIVSYIVIKEDDNFLLEISGVDYKVAKGKKDETQFKKLEEQACALFSLENFLIRWSSVYFKGQKENIWTGRINNSSYMAAGYNYSNLTLSTIAAATLAAKILHSKK